MSYSTTLTSLAILKVNIDHDRDYLDYLRPFVLNILAHENLDRVTDEKIHQLILTKFGLYIPPRSIQIILKRIARKYPLKKQNNIYKVTGDLKPNINIEIQKSKAKRHIQAVISGLMTFSQSTVTPINSDERAKKAILDFLSKFNIPCLKAYLRGTALPNIEQSYKRDIVLVSKYIISLQKTSPERFESFMILVQGHMLANALTCPDLTQIPDTYKNVTFYFDTPLLIQLLGLDTDYAKRAVENLIELLKRLNGKIAVFSHSRDELKWAIQSSAEYINKQTGRGSIVREARQSGKTKSDLLLLAQQIDDKLLEFQIQVENTPRYDPDKYRFQIDESILDDMLKDEVFYINPEAKKHDINSVRSIYVLRKGMSPDTVERSKAILVSSNKKFAKVAWKYGRTHEELRQVSSVITSFSLANMAWLKAPMGANNLPEIEVLAFSYSALRPTTELLNKYLIEIENLEKDGKITEKYHQLLRSSLHAQKELMNMTMGDEKALTEETIKETLSRVTSEIKKEEVEKLTKEQKQHQATQKKLAEEKKKRQETENRLYWHCDKTAKYYSWISTGLVIIALFVIQFVIVFISIYFKLLLVYALIYALIVSSFLVVSSIFRWPDWKMQKQFKKWFLRKLLKKEEQATGLNFKNKDSQPEE